MRHRLFSCFQKLRFACNNLDFHKYEPFLSSHCLGLYTYTCMYLITVSCINPLYCKPDIDNMNMCMVCANVCYCISFTNTLILHD